jgi:hypothetical protein
LAIASSVVRQNGNHRHGNTRETKARGQDKSSHFCLTSFPKKNQLPIPRKSWFKKSFDRLESSVMAAANQSSSFTFTLSLRLRSAKKLILILSRNFTRAGQSGRMSVINLSESESAVSRQEN